MKKSSMILLSLLCMFALGSVVSFASLLPKNADHQSITFTQPMVLAGNQLPAGTYAVVHQMQGEDHYMIFRLQNVPKSKAVEVKVKCELTPLNAKAHRTETRYVHNANQNILTEVTFAGERAKHVFEAPAV